MKTYRICDKCREEISVYTESWLQMATREWFLNLKCHFHYKKHGIKYLSMKGLVKSLFICGGALLLRLTLAPFWLITLPFWWVHEKISD